VNLEALAHGVPTVAFARGRVAEDIGETGGIAVDCAKDFPRAVAAYLDTFVADPAAARQHAVQRYRELVRTVAGPVRPRPGQ
jgi:glycosyltransferase involved in cell wall biosynthesis